MKMGSIKTFVAGLALVSFSALPAVADGPVQQVGLFAKKAEECAKDSKKAAKKKASDSKKKASDSKKKAGCDADAGCDGDNGGCNLLQRAMNKTGLGRALSDAGVKVSGWAQFGYHSDSNGLFNSHPDDFNLHQLWFSARKAADGGDGTSLGFAADLVYGVDGPDVQSIGNPDEGDFDRGGDWTRGGGYGWAMPQLYAEIQRGDLNLIGGHFFSPVGYEQVAAPENFFYSRSKTMYNRPLTHTGLLAKYNITEELETSFGWTAGWDTGFDRRTGADQGSNLLASVGFTPIEGISLTYVALLGDFGSRRRVNDGPADVQLGEGYMHSVVASLDILDDVKYVVQSNLRETNAATANDQISITNYLQYDINDTLAAGARIEWFKSDGASEYDVTFGLNIKPRDCLVIRPEIRTDWGNGIAAPETDDRSIFGIDMILSY